MIILFTDFGLSGPYIGQMKAVLTREAPQAPVIGLFSDAPAFDPELSAHLLAAYAGEFPLDSVFLCVVDPGVGSARAPVIVRADGRWFVGPDNGLFNVVAQRASRAQWWDITYQPKRLSATFHGRDVFAPVAARLARHQPPPGQLRTNSDMSGQRSDDLARIVYIDHYGNALTGLRARSLRDTAILSINGVQLSRARTFSDVAEGVGFWYENSSGLAEIAVNRGRADVRLGLVLGAPIAILEGGAQA
jgi:S-adenosyl-L-methionine hydrolase (adenosine-forming)